MPRCLTVSPHLSPTDLERRYRHCRHAVERSHWQMVWLVAQGHHVPAVARLTGYSMPWVRTIVHRYNAEGAAGIVDQRQHSRGHPPLLTPALRDELADALDGPAPDGGIWTCAKVAAWMAGGLGRPVGEPRGWEAMRALGFSPQRPRPRATQADPAAQAAFKKGGSRPRSTRSGPRPIAWVRRRYQWLYVYAFVRPTTGQSWWALVPTVTTAAMTQMLAAFASDEGIDAAHRAVLVLDGAGWHTSKRLVVPDSIDLVFLPPASPELQPVERVWSLVDEPVVNRTFADLNELTEVLVTRCQTLRAAKRQIKAHTDYHWWAIERRRRMLQ